MKNYAWDYETDYYHIYNVGDVVDDEIWEFTLPESQDNDELIKTFVIALEGVAAAGGHGVNCTDHADCQLNDKCIEISNALFGVNIEDHLKELTADDSPNKLVVSTKETLYYLKRLTVYANRTAQYLRGERDVC